MKARDKSNHDGLSGVSARMPENDLKNFRVMMTRLKSKHGGGFSLSDLLQVVTSMKPDILDSEIISSQGTASAFIRKLDVSDEAKGKA